MLNPLHIPGAWITNQLLQNSSIQFKAEVAVSMEDRRSWWTTCKKFSTWFNNSECTLSQLGFGKHLDGKFIISNDKQLGQIINIDEITLCLDGNEGQCGGSTSAEFVDTELMGDVFQF